MKIDFLTAGEALEYLEFNKLTTKNINHVRKISLKTYNIGIHYSPQKTFTHYRRISSKLELIDIWVTEDGHILLASRGTHGIKAWLENGDLLPIIKNSMLDGFHDGYLSIKHTLRFAISYLLSTFWRRGISPKFYLTGYSRGGAIIQIIRTELPIFDNNSTIEIVKTVTFASPMPFTKKGKYEYDIQDHEEGSSTFNVINDGDPVPLLPPIKFYRTGTFAKIGKANKFLKNIFGINAILYHTIATYKKSLKQKAGDFFIGSYSSF